MYPSGPASWRAAFNVEPSDDPFRVWNEEKVEGGGGGNIKDEFEIWDRWPSKLAFEKSSTYPAKDFKQLEWF